MVWRLNNFEKEKSNEMLKMKEKADLHELKLEQIGVSVEQNPMSFVGEGIDFGDEHAPFCV